MILIPTLIVGVPTAAILGLIGGALLGIPFIGGNQRLTKRNILGLGMIRSLPLAVIYALCMHWMFGWLGGGLATEWILWIIPGMIAFFGFWWVTVKINERMPTL